MSLDSPQTYGEFYWRQAVDASLAEQEKYEKELSPTVSSLVHSLNIDQFLPSYLAGFLSTLQSPTSPAWGNILGRFTSEVADGIVGQTLNHALMDYNYKMASWFKDLRIDKDTCSILKQRGKISEEMYNSRMESSGFKEAEGAAYYESKLPYPTINEIITYSRYHSDADNPKELVWKLFDVSERDYELFNWLSLMKPNTEQVLSLYKREFIEYYEADNELARIGWHKADRPSILELAYSLPNPMLMVQGDLLQEVDSEKILKDISKGDIHPSNAQQYLDAILTKPASSDIIAYQLRKDSTLSELDKELKRIGVHPLYFDLYKELAYQIPPVADIITMAVREAFTPDIARRFGQYDDFPTDFAEWAGKKGLNREWAERYWAAHWSLPSPQQGFEMLHRGVINESDLNLLLRACDIMPFWRDKLIQIAYNPLTRVDIRRMYMLGVINESEVNKAYHDLGYNEDNSKQLTAFTVKQTRQSQSRFSPANVINAYKNRLISSSDLQNILSELGVKDSDIYNIVKTATYQREWDFKNDQISAIGNLYKKHRLSENDLRRRLSELNLPSEEINILVQKWTYKAEEEAVPTWTTAQTISFLKKGLISRDRAIAELKLIGYNDERISVYLKAVST